MQTETSEQPEEVAAGVSADAYQVIGALADAAGLFTHPEVQRALDYFGYEQWREPGKEILPFHVPNPVVQRAAEIEADADESRSRLRSAMKGPSRRRPVP